MRTNKAMGKPTKKIRVIYNSEVIDRLIEKYGVSKRYVTMSISGDRKSETSDSIKADYKTMTKEIDSLLKNL